MEQSSILVDDSSEEENFGVHMSTDDEDAFLESDISDISTIKEVNYHEMDQSDNTEVIKLSVDQKDGPKDLTVKESPKKVIKDDSLGKKEQSFKRKSAISKKTVYERSADSSTDTGIPNINNKIDLKVSRPKNLSKPSVKTLFTLQVDGISFTVHETEGNEKANATRAKISKKSSKMNSPKSGTSEMAGNTHDESIQHQGDGQNIMMETDKPKESEKTLRTPTSSNKEVNMEEPIEENNMNPKSATNSKAQLSNKTSPKDFSKVPYEALEDICLQNICKAICHKSKIGELQDQLRVQQRMSNKLKLEVDRLSKQAKDLKLINQSMLYKLNSPDTTGQ